MEGLSFNRFPDKRLLTKDDDIRAYLAGVFLACGSVNNPDTEDETVIIDFVY